MRTKLLIKDEVNIKFEGLDLSTRKKLSDKFKFRVPYAHHLPSVKLGRWDGCINFFQLGGSSYLHLLDQILPLVEKAGYEIDLEDLRINTTEFSFVEVDKDSYGHFSWPKGHVHENQAIELRDYQVEIINKFLANPQGLQEIATGAGKTIVTAVLSQKCEKYGRTIIIVPNKSLVNQTEEDYKILNMDVGVYFGDRKEYNKKHTICTWQSLNNLLKNTKNKVGEHTIHEFIEDVICIMVDEAHGTKADVLKAMLTGIFAHIPIRWGLTGTIPKELFEFNALLVSLGPVIHRIQTHELQAKDVLANCNVNIVQLIDHINYGSYPKELSYLVTNDDRVKYISNLIKNMLESGNTLVLVDRIKTGKLLNTLLPDSVFISGSTHVKNRKEHYDEVADYSNKLIVATYGVAAVGINIPRIFNLVLLEPGKSFVRVIQSIGRGVRKAKDKNFVQIWDIASTSKFSHRHLLKRKQFYKDQRYEFQLEKVVWQ